MTTISTNRITTLANHWKAHWAGNQMTARLKELIGEFLSRLLTSLVITGSAGATAVYLVPNHVTIWGVEFLALVYMLILGIATAHSFDENRVNFILRQIQTDLVHIGELAGYSHLDEIKRSIDELTTRMGQS